MLDIPESGFKGLDELASELGVGPAQPDQGPHIQLEGKSGTFYSLTEILQAHLDRLRDST
jgi:hypothetical protein